MEVFVHNHFRLRAIVESIDSPTEAYTLSSRRQHGTHDAGADNTLSCLPQHQPLPMCDVLRKPGRLAEAAGQAAENEHIMQSK